MIVDLFAGAGGWDHAAHQLALHPIGIEVDHDTCATRAAAGLATIRAELGPDGYRLPPGTHLTGLIGSPPCQAFSAAGHRDGADQLNDYIAALETSGWSPPEGDWHPDLHLLTETIRWVIDHEPTWVAFEQVRAVLPFWRAAARRLRALGWWTAVGLLNAANYGVPQCRVRAILMAHRDRPVTLPTPTHTPVPDLFGSAPWVTMADALNLDPGTTVDLRQNSSVGGGRRVPYHRSADRPASTITGRSGRSQWVLNPREHNKPRLSLDRPAPTLTGSAVDRNWCFERPATTIAGDLRCHPPGHKFNQDDIDRLGETEARARYNDRAGTDSVLLTIAQAAALQSFPPNWPWQGTQASKARQIGNAVPVHLAGHILGALTGIPYESEDEPFNRVLILKKASKA
jgi:DNA (cytosine-5)-methyltransferase 1